MFTGIIEEVGTVTDVSSMGTGIRLGIYAPATSHELRVHDSVAVNGVCLTVVARSPDEFSLEAVEETLKKTTLGGLAVGDHVNLELPLKYHERLHGHLVLGHVDTVGVITKVAVLENSSLFTIQVPTRFEKYLIEVGSVAVDGTSLTVAELRGNVFTVSIIPHTMENTTCRYYEPERKVNVEFDVLGKYVEQLTKAYHETHGGKPFYTEGELKSLGY